MYTEEGGGEPQQSQPSVITGSEWTVAGQKQDHKDMLNIS